MEKDDLFKRSVDTQACVDILAGTKIGDVIPWDTFVDATGRDLERVRSNILAARRILEGDETRMVFGVVRKVGLKRIGNNEIPDTAETIEAHIRRSAHRGVRRLKCADYAKLDKHGQIKWNTQMTVLSLHQKVATTATRKQIAAAVETTGMQLPIGKALKTLGVVNEGG